ncbi:hypothetical protein [Candidatus Methanoprimaticola sp. MG2]|uniref:hypothetical protein n=1 Tax=Candidatus Methanoprimaticola sp. MG2 TaxID=3228838 RepID=UPI0039C696D7
MTKGGEKGYGFQDNVKSYFVLLMDLERTIHSVDSEINTEKTHSMDDIEIIMDDGQHCFLQCKNYSELKISEIKIEGSEITIRAAKHLLSPNGKNVLIVHNWDISPTTQFMGLDATNIGDVVVARCNISDRDLLSNRYQSQLRVNKILDLVDKHTENGVGLITRSELPLLCTYSTKLLNDTVNIDRGINIQLNEINCIVGKPGSGKSHYCNTMMNKLDPNDCILYRFWISNDDPDYEKRLSYEEFIYDLSKKLFDNPDIKTDAQIIERIKQRGHILILDGLDHVYNYRPTEYKYYESFIDRLSGHTLVIFCRPFKELKWMKMELDDWSKDQSDYFIEKAFDISDVAIQNEIFDSVKGYPLLTYYVAKNYTVTKKVQNYSDIVEISDYYAKLFEPINEKTLLSVLSISPRYLTEADIDCLLESPFNHVVKEFINQYSFLFSSKLNRFSPLHDSFCNYLKSIPECNNRDFHDLIVKKAIESLLCGETRFMSRVGSFGLNQEQKQQLLHGCCNYDYLINVLNNTYDWESVVDFYRILKSFLDDCSNCFSLSEYYEFILISLILDRNLAIEDEKLMYYCAKQMVMQDKEESDVFSMGLLWAMIVKIKTGSGNVLFQWAKDNNQNTENYLEILDDDLKKDTKILNLPNDDKYRNRINYEPISEQWARCGYLSYVYDDESDAFRKHVVELIEKPIEYKCKILDYLISIGVKKSEYDFNSIPRKIIDYLYRSGKLREGNPYLESIDAIITSEYKRGSFDVGESIKKCLILADVENRIVNLDGLWKYLFMYWERKDSSVLFLPHLLMMFESKGLISMVDSIWLIVNLQDMSEKGIRHLLSEYVNDRGEESVKYCIEHHLQEYLYYYYIFKPETIDMLPDVEIINEFDKLTRNVDNINYYSIASIIESRHRDLLLKLITLNHISVRGVPSDLSEVFSNCQCDYRENEEPGHHDIVLDNYVRSDDEKTIIEQKISMLDLAKYHDGWHNVLPFPELYANYDSIELNNNYGVILHKSLFTKYYQKWYGSWNLCPYTVLRLAEIANVDINWHDYFDLFKRFMSISLVWDTTSGEE